MAIKIVIANIHFQEIGTKMTRTNRSCPAVVQPRCHRLHNPHHLFRLREGASYLHTSFMIFCTASSGNFLPILILTSLVHETSFMMEYVCSDTSDIPTLGLVFFSVACLTKMVNKITKFSFTFYSFKSFAKCSVLFLNSSF